MHKFSNPLDKIKIASPCGANWDEMIGNDRRRYCAECKLNVYNLSDMKREEAENFLIGSEGRVCLRVFRRNDDTVLTQNCPVGWQAVKRKISRVATAVFALIAGFFGGILSLESLRSFRSLSNYDKIPEKASEATSEKISFYVTDGILENLSEIKASLIKTSKF